MPGSILLTYSKPYMDTRKRNVCHLMLRNFSWTQKHRCCYSMFKASFIYIFPLNTLHANMYSCVNMKVKVFVQYKETKKQSIYNW